MSGWYWFGVVFSTIGATVLLFALTLVSTVVGTYLIGPMITLMSGPIIDKLTGEKRQA